MYKLPILLLLSFVISNVLNAQINKSYMAEYDTLTKNVIKYVRIPRRISEECKSSAVSFIITFKEMGNDLIFSKNFPPDFKKEIAEKIKVFESIKWGRIFPEVEKRKKYSVMIPIIYYFDLTCLEKINSQEFAELINDGLSFDKSPTRNLYFLKPIKIELGKPIP